MSSIFMRKQPEKQLKTVLGLLDLGSYFLLLVGFAYANVFSNPTALLVLVAVQLTCFIAARIYGAYGLASVGHAFPNKRSRYDIATDTYEKTMPAWERWLYFSAEVTIGLLITSALVFAVLIYSVGAKWLPSLLTNPIVSFGGAMMTYSFVAVSGIMLLLGGLRIWDRFQQRKQGILEAAALESPTNLARLEGDAKVTRAVGIFLLDILIEVGISAYFMTGMQSLPLSIAMVSGLGLMLLYKVLVKGQHDSRLIGKTALVSKNATGSWEFKKFTTFHQAKAGRRGCHRQLILQQVVGEGVEEVKLQKSATVKNMPKGYTVASTATT